MNTATAKLVALRTALATLILVAIGVLSYLHEAAASEIREFIPKAIDLSQGTPFLRTHNKPFFGTCRRWHTEKLEGQGIVSIGDMIRTEDYKIKVGLMKATYYANGNTTLDVEIAKPGETICIIAKNKESLPSEEDCDALWIKVRDCSAK